MRCWIGALSGSPRCVDERSYRKVWQTRTRNRSPRSWHAIPVPSSSLATIPGRLPHSRRTIDHEMAKVMTRSEAEEKRRKAVEFLRHIGKPEDAERFAQMTPD